MKDIIKLVLIDKERSMPVSIKLTRGDINLRDDSKMKDGQLFYSYVNTDPIQSKGHTYSQGQLWIKDNDKIREIANARSIDSVKFAGFITKEFNGNFETASETTQPEFRHCHAGDFFIFKKDDKVNFTEKFYKGDILLITKAVYETIADDFFRETLTHVDYIRIPGSEFNNEGTDYESETIQGAIKELEIRLFYLGEINSTEEFESAPKKKGGLYLIQQRQNKDVVGQIVANLEEFDADAKTYNGRVTDSGYLKLRYGDMIFWNGETWTLIPTGLTAEDIPYNPKVEEIEAIPTFETFHKQRLKGVTSISEAIDILNIHKAPLDNKGKIPYSVLPTSVTTGLNYQGKFFPLIDPKGSITDPSNQENWPTPVDMDGELLDEWKTGWFFIVDCQNRKNVQYKDKTQPNRVIELNTGDWVVWNGKDAIKQFEVVDNSDRVSAVEVHKGEEIITLLGVVGIETTGKYLTSEVDDNVFKIGLKGDFIEQDPEVKGKENYYPKYTADGMKLTNSHIHEKDETVISDWDFSVGESLNYKILKIFGEGKIYPTIDNTAVLGYINHSFDFVTALPDENLKPYFRKTSVVASTLKNLQPENDIEVILPEATSKLVGVFNKDVLDVDYLTKVNKDGFITDSMQAERFVKGFESDFEDGYFNVGIGRTTSEDLETGEITFYAKSKDKYKGFNVVTKKSNDPFGPKSDLVEHVLERETNKTSLLINPYIFDNESTTNWLPYSSGVLITWEEVLSMYGTGEDLMIPSWEKHRVNGKDYMGLSSSPMRIRVNRKASGNEIEDHENDLSKDYGNGLKSAFDYIGSDHSESIQEEEQGSISDIVTFDAWVSAQRAVSSKEAFILPSNTYVDDESSLDHEDNEATPDPAAKKSKLYGKDGKGGSFSRILPSRTVFKDSPQYYDVDGKLIPQSVAKNIELPAESGVLLTDNSIIRCPTYH